MAGYVKKIALIKGIKSGFSADGGPLSGLVKCQSYAGFLKVETSLINFAPLSEGKYLFGICDGERVITFDKEVFEEECDFNLTSGFSFLVVFCHNKILPVAEACCCRTNLSKTIYEAICAAEKTTEVKGADAKDDKLLKNEKVKGGTAGDINGTCANISGQEAESNADNQSRQYNDEAIAEADYYEYKDNEGDGAVCTTEKEEENGRNLQKNEDDIGSFKEGENSVNGSADTHTQGENCEKNKELNFYESKREEIEKIFSSYPKDDKLESVIEGSRWARINYGESDYYAFGEVYVRGKIKYLCYAVPINSGKSCPESLKARSSLIKAQDTFYRVIYQSATNGEVVKR